MIFAAVAVAFLFIGIFALKNGNGNGKEVYRVQRGTVSQIVSVTGKTQAVNNVDLSFEKSGRVANISVNVGDQVKRGQILASLDTEELRAQLSDAEANVEVQKAKLQEILIGTRPEDIQIKTAELSKAEQDLESYYGGAINILNAAYNKADDAIRKQLDPLFLNDEDLNVSLLFSVNNSQLETDIEDQRLEIGLMLKNWVNELNSISLSLSREQADKMLSDTENHLAVIQIFLNRASQAVANSLSLSEATIETYKGNIDTARANVNAAITSVTGRKQDIAAQKLVVLKAKYQLDLSEAGYTKEQITAQEAQVKQALAKAEVIRAQINQNIIFAPFSGLIARQDLEIGEVATANKPFISLISDEKLEVEANVPEVNIGKVTVGNSAKIKLDAFSDEIFDGQVVYVEPAETLIEGVVNYKIKIAFDKPEEKIRSGLTADIDIIIFSKDGILKIPSYSLLVQEDGSFAVKVINGRQTEIRKVEVGIRGSGGETEIISGLSEGEEILATIDK